MMGIIVGKNRVEYISVKKKDLKKHFFVTRDQMYKFYPDLMQKIFIEDEIGLIRSETGMIYPENGIRPYGWIEPEDDYDPFGFDTILADIEDHKDPDRIPLSRWKMYFTTGKSIWRSLAPVLPFALVGIVLLLAFTGVLH